MKVTFRGWPWQLINPPGKTPHWSNITQKPSARWGWNPFKVKGMGRFGGGWAIKFGITISETGRDIILDCGIGSIRIKTGERR